MPSSNNDLNRAQLESDVGMYGDDDILHTNNDGKERVWRCSKCNETMDLYWKKHHHCKTQEEGS